MEQRKAILRVLRMFCAVAVLCTAGSRLSAQDSPVPDAANQPAATQATTADYRIGIDDILSISVWQEPELSRNVPVRPDGKISLPLVGDITAAGLTAAELQVDLKERLSHFVKNPELTVIVSDIRSRRINVIGQVNRPGAFSLTQSMGVLDAIAEAGGLRDFAKKNAIYVLRLDGDGQRKRISFDYKAVVSGKGHEVLLQPRDTVVVP